MTPRNLAAWFAVSLLLPAALAQKTGTTTTTTTTGSTGSTTNNGTTNAGSLNLPGTGSSKSTTSTMGSAPPIYLSGRVVMDDGSELPGPVTLERVCSGTATHAEGYTDMKGNFSIQFGNESGVFQDATDAPSRSSMGGLGPGGLGMGGGMDSTSGMGMGAATERMLDNCELRARLPGYRSQTINLAGRRAMDAPDIGTILLHREGPGEGATVSMTTLKAPKAARSAFDKGQQLIKKNKPAEAREEFEKAVQIDQEFAAAWCELGKLQSASGDAEMARGSFRVAMKADPKFVGAYLELSAIALNAKKWQEAADLTDQALKLDSFDYPQAYLFNAAAKYNMQEMDAADKSIREAERLDTQHKYPEIAHLIGAILQYRHDYPGAAAHYRAYLKMAPNADDVALVRKQLEAVEKLTTAQK